MDERYWTHHGYAINVKDHSVYDLDPDDVLTEVERIYEDHQGSGRRLRR